MSPLFLLLLAVVAPSALALKQCKNEKGKGVEWFIAYKLPKTKGRGGSDIDTKGVELAYIDSTMKAAKKAGKNEPLKGPWRMLKATVLDVENSPLAHTLADFYKGKKPSDSLYAIYNDQPPEKYNGTAKGHTKGVIQFDKNSGYWLMHSVPRYPFNLFSKKYEYPESGTHNGQTFMCISFKGPDQLVKVASALRQQYPYIYEVGAPKGFSKHANVTDLLHKKFVRKPANPILEDKLKGSQGTEFESFAKHQRANDEIYANIIGPSLDSDLLVQTWRNGAGGKLGPTCPLKGVTVTNLANIIIRFQNGKKVEFKTTEDHAKWAVSADPSKPWFCIGSLNRMLSQYKRGGQTTCMKNAMVHRAFTSAVDTCETCAVPRKNDHYCKKSVEE